MHRYIINFSKHSPECCMTCLKSQLALHHRVEQATVNIQLLQYTFICPLVRPLVHELNSANCRNLSVICRQSPQISYCITDEHNMIVTLSRRRTDLRTCLSSVVDRLLGAISSRHVVDGNLGVVRVTCQTQSLSRTMNSISFSTRCTIMQSCTY